MDANVLKALNNQEDGFKRPSLNNVLIYGRVRCLISRPALVGKGIRETNGYFALLDAYALKCLGEDYFREDTYDVNSIYFTKGSVLIYIDDPSWVGKDVKVFGKSKYYGANIRRQKSKSSTEGISAFMFGAPEREGGTSVYPLVPNVLVELNSKDPDARGTVLEDFIVSITKGDDIPYPETLECIVPYSGIDEYNELVVDETESKKISSIKRNKVAYTASKEKIDVSKIDMNLVYHLDGQPVSEYYDVVKDDFEHCSVMRGVYIDSLLNFLDESYKDNCDYLSENYFRKLFIENVAKHPMRTLGIYAKDKVKSFLEEFIDNCDLQLSTDEEEDGVDKTSITKGIENLRKLVYTDYTVLYGNSGEDSVDTLPVLKSDFLFTLNVIGVCTGIGSETLLRNLNYCGAVYHMDEEVWLYALVVNPYMLGLMGTGLSTVDCDTLYYSIGTTYEADEDMYELAEKCRSYLLMLDTLDNCSKGIFYKGINNRAQNTFVNIKDYKRADCNYPEKALKNILNFNFIQNSEITDLLSMLLKKVVTVDKNFEPSLKKWYSKGVFDELVENGIINTINDYCALQRDLERELLIYNTFEAMGKDTTGITDEVIEEGIRLFEQSRGFKLESLQKEGIKLCKYHAGVLSGCAGSGKTTTSDCLTEIISTLRDVNIVYCTPTGKACRRLAEVVHRPVKTLHSQFGILLGGSSYLQMSYKPKEKRDKKGITVYILDEMAMCSTDLLYNVAKYISKEDIVYFLGDIKQLPPIGRGCPFKVLMSLLPCVELGVSKRAAEGSLINYNTSLINFMSNPVCKELSYDDKTFIAKDCEDISIVPTVRDLFKGFISGELTGTKYLEDDIQVISGYQAKEKLSSVNRLNKPIQEDLRKYDNILYYRESRDPKEENQPYYANDRVIYVNKNSYDICRYVLEPDGTFHQVITFGCVNGEMGKLVGVIPSNNIKIVPCDKREVMLGEGIYSDFNVKELNSMIERYESREDSMRDDTFFKGDNFYFVVVKVYDTDLKRDVYILLRGTGKYRDVDFCLSGSDLSNLNLAYALTCHKMQGSQNKVIIAVFESKGNPDFINRNMINTIVTRSQEVVCCVGSVTGEDSMINRGRQFVHKADSHDLLAMLTGNDSWLVK